MRDPDQAARECRTLQSISALLCENAALERCAAPFATQVIRRETLSGMAAVNRGLSRRLLDAAHVDEEPEDSSPSTSAVTFCECLARGDYRSALKQIGDAEARGCSIICGALADVTGDFDLEALLTFSLRILEFNQKSVLDMSAELDSGNEL